MTSAEAPQIPRGPSGSNPARSVGTEAAADALQSESAFYGLSFYAVVGSFHGKAGDIALQRLVGTLACGTAITVIHTFLPP